VTETADPATSLRTPPVRTRFHEQLDQLVRVVNDMGEKVAQAIQTSVEALEALDVVRAQELIQNDNQLDALRIEIERQAFLLLATQQPTAVDLRIVTSTTSVAAEVERIGDYCAGIAKLTLTMAAEPKGEPSETIRAMANLTSDSLRQAIGAYTSRDVETAKTIWSRDDEIDDLYRDFFRHQIEEMVHHKKRVRRGTYMLWIAHNIERMADRVTNIAEAVAFVATGDLGAWRSDLEAESVPTSF
jgi:phosphate transport system protein